MRITDIRETSIALNSTLKNSSIDFSEMTTSVVAVITDVVRDGKPVVGFAFNSTGRYACGAQMRARFIPRILKAEPESLLNEAGDNLDPDKILAVMMQQREVRRAHASARSASARSRSRCGTRSPRSPASRCIVLLAERYSGGKVLGQDASSMSAAAGTRRARASPNCRTR